MTSKKWIALFLATLLLIGAGTAMFNYLTDPFGVFPGSFLEWPSYEMTINPRTAKFTYLQEHHDEYDSYIIGCSSSSSYPTDTLNRYFNANFYNLIMYGADMLDVEQWARYVIEHYTVKNLVISVYIDNALAYDTEQDPLSYSMPSKANGSNNLAFYARYLFADPRHGLDKLKARGEDHYLPQTFDVFNETTGAYDKRARDAEPISSLEDYLAVYPIFANYPDGKLALNGPAMEGTLHSIATIKDLCKERGVNLMVVCNPVYSEYMDYFSWGEVAGFYTRLADVTPYWDFTLSSVSFEPRYFYDKTHFRNCVGDMALARIFGDETVYVPEDFGEFVTSDTVSDHLAKMSEAQAIPKETYTTRVAAVMYHHFTENPSGSTDITPELFRKQLTALKEAGFTSVTPDDLQAYVCEGAELPEKPLVITIDDGYYSNYKYAYPILRELGMKATIFVIGSTVGNKEHYKNTEFPITPHFSWDEAEEMVDSGMISIQSHTYDMHQWAPYEKGQARENILIWPDEDEWEYAKTLSEDLKRSRKEIGEGTGESNVHVLGYPSGASNTLAQAVLLENGFDVTFSTVRDVNTLVRGLPQSLLCLRRFGVDSTITSEELVRLVSRQ